MKLFNWPEILKMKSLKDQKAAIAGAFSYAIQQEVEKELASQPLLEALKMRGIDTNLQGQAPVVFADPGEVAHDRGYEMIFKEFDMRSSQSSNFEVLDITGGVTFYQTESGEKAKLSKIPKGAKQSVDYLRFMGGFSVLDDWLRFNQYYKVDQLADSTTNKWWENRAKIFYGMIEALTSIGQAFDTDDIITINNAAAQIINDLKGTDTPAGDSSKFIVLCNPNQKMRILKAIAATFTAPNANNNQLVYTIGGVVSTAEIASGDYYLCLPGGKNIRGEWEDLNARPAQRDELKLGSDLVWTGMYNGIIGNKKQFRKCALS